MDRSGRQYLPAMTLAFVLLVTSLFPVPESAGEQLPTLLSVTLDKWVHAASYGALTGLLAWGRRSRDWVVVAGLATLAIGYGACIELLQGLVPSRGASGTDIVANAAGALLAGVAWLASRQRDDEV